MSLRELQRMSCEMSEDSDSVKIELRSLDNHTRISQQQNLTLWVIPASLTAS